MIPVTIGPSEMHCVIAAQEPCENALSIDLYLKSAAKRGLHR